MKEAFSKENPRGLMATLKNVVEESGSMGYDEGGRKLEY